MPCSRSEAILDLQKKFLRLYINAVDFSPCATGTTLRGEHLHSAGVLGAGRKRGVSLQPADDEAARFPGLQALCTESRAPSWCKSKTDVL